MYEYYPWENSSFCFLRFGSLSKVRRLLQTAKTELSKTLSRVERWCSSVLKFNQISTDWNHFIRFWSEQKRRLQIYSGSVGKGKTLREWVADMRLWWFKQGLYVYLNTRLKHERDFYYYTKKWMEAINYKCFYLHKCFIFFNKEGIYI